MEEIEKLKEYKKELNNLQTKINKNTYTLLIGVIIIAYKLKSKTEELDNESLNIILTIIGSYLSVYNLRHLIENLHTKTKIETLIEIIELNKTKDYTKKLQ